MISATLIYPPSRRSWSAEQTELIRRYIDAPGRHYHIYHGRTTTASNGSLPGRCTRFRHRSKRMAEKQKKADAAAEKAASRRLVWAGRIRRFEKSGIVFQSEATPVIYGYDYLEWIDLHPRPDKSDMKIDSKKELGGVYIRREDQDGRLHP